MDLDQAFCGDIVGFGLFSDDLHSDFRSSEPIEASLSVLRRVVNHTQTFEAFALNVLLSTNEYIFFLVACSSS